MQRITKNHHGDTEVYKRSYHPLLIVLFHLNLLDRELLRQIPYSTRKYWNDTEQENQFGYDAVHDYLKSQLDIRAVFTSKQLYRFVRFACRMHDGYTRIIDSLGQAKKTKNRIQKILVDSVAHLSQNVCIPIATRVMNISSQKYYRWKSFSECKLSKIKRCFRQVPHQLTLREIQTIDRAMKNPENLGRNKISVYYPLLIAQGISCSLATFYNYCRDEMKRIPKPSIVHETLRATYVFQYLHVDITELICTTGKILLAFVKDNFSKVILNGEILPDKSSVHIRDLFAEVFERFHLRQHPERISIVSDGGSENKGELLLWIAQQVIPEVKKLTAGIEVKSNSMSESVHHILKGEFLQYKPPTNPQKAIDEFIHYHNHLRYPTEHYGYTCWEVLNGAVPDKNRFKLQLLEARKKRVQENQQFHCLKETKCDELRFD